MDLTLHVWRQNGPNDKGRFETLPANNISEHMSFLEMLDLVNEQLIEQGCLARVGEYGSFRVLFVELLEGVTNRIGAAAGIV